MPGLYSLVALLCRHQNREIRCGVKLQTGEILFTGSAPESTGIAKIVSPKIFNFLVLLIFHFPREVAVVGSPSIQKIAQTKLFFGNFRL